MQLVPLDVRSISSDEWIEEVGGQVDTPVALERVLLFSGRGGAPAVRLRDVATVNLVKTPSTIRRDRQQRIVEVSANITGGTALSEVHAEAMRRLADLQLPPGYSLYDGGATAHRSTA